MWAPKRLEIGWGDLAFAGLQCLRMPGRQLSGDEIARGWIESPHALACLSVRSGLDLWLSALELPPGSEVLLSAINIPDMADILRHHGLIAVPVDVDPATYHTTAAAIQKQISPQTRIILIAHLFGRRAELDEIAAIAKRHGILLVEDCAQAFAGRGYTGHAASDVALFSFGPIKTATALGGAVLRVQDREILARMLALQTEFPRQRRWQYLGRACKYAALKLLTTGPLYGAFVRGLRRLGINHNRFIHGRLRSFNSHADLLNSLRRRPCEPLLRVLRRRIQQFDDNDLHARTANARRLAEGLAKRGIATLSPQETDSFWVFPYSTRGSATLIERLLEEGFDVARQSSLVALEPAESHHPTPHVAQELIESLVFLPAYKEMPPEEIDRLADLVAAVEATSRGVAIDTRGTAA